MTLGNHRHPKRPPRPPRPPPHPPSHSRGPPGPPPPATPPPPSPRSAAPPPAAAAGPPAANPPCNSPGNSATASASAPNASTPSAAVSNSPSPRPRYFSPASAGPAFPGGTWVRSSPLLRRPGRFYILPATWGRVPLLQPNSSPSSALSSELATRHFPTRRLATGHGRLLCYPMNRRPSQP